ncbi:MAG: VOC family protein, partial [Proteobacteria bacterium]|nr:VOC family protein [Pseudomonadota bacterium]
MIELINLQYVRLGTQDIDGAVNYATDVLGLEVGRRDGNTVYLRSDHKDHTLAYFDGSLDDHTVGVELRDQASLDAAVVALESAGIDVYTGTDTECAERRCRSFINFKDPTGNSFDLVVRPYHARDRYFPSRDAGITGFSHIGLRTSDPARDEIFWTTHFNIRASDWLGECGLLTFDEVHHRFALFPSDRPGVQHINHQVESIDDIMRSYYFLTEKQVHITFGPGRHPTSTAMFLYFDGPEGMTFEYSCGVRLITDPENDRPRQFPAGPENFCM